MNFIHIPWIEAQGDSLLRSVFDAAPDLSLTSLPIIRPDILHARRQMLHFARRFPKCFASMFERRLLSIDRPAHGLVLTLDWPAPMRIAAQVAKEHGLPVILIPHEGAFIDRDRFYVDIKTGVNTPVADIFLAWGNLQKEILSGRGYPEEKIRVVCSPKLQAAVGYSPVLTREEYCRRLGLVESRPIVLFAAQILDNVAEISSARLTQARAVMEVSDLCKKNSYQLILRPPPILHDTILQAELEHRIGLKELVVVGSQPGRPETNASEALFHADCVVSISSTMLLEKGLMNGPALGLNYLPETSPFIDRGALASAVNATEIAATLPRLVASRSRSFSEDGWLRMAKDYSNGSFDNIDALQTIADILRTYDTSHSLAGRRPTHQIPVIPNIALQAHGIAYAVRHRLLPAIKSGTYGQFRAVNQ